MARSGWLCPLSGPQDEKPDFHHFYSFGDESTLRTPSPWPGMLDSLLKLEPRTLFILQEPAAKPQGMTSNLEIMAMGNVIPAKFWLFRRGVVRAGRERHWGIGKRHGACYMTLNLTFQFFHEWTLKLTRSITYFSTMSLCCFMFFFKI